MIKGGLREKKGKTKTKHFGTLFFFVSCWLMTKVVVSRIMSLPVSLFYREIIAPKNQEGKTIKQRHQPRVTAHNG